MQGLFILEVWICAEILDAGARYVVGCGTFWSRKEVDPMIDEIRHTRPSFVLNDLVGSSSYAFLRAIACLAKEDSSLGTSRCQVLSCNPTECELPALGERGEGLVSVGR